MTVRATRADAFSIDQLAGLWNAAYTGYWFNVQQTPAQLERRFRTTDVDLTASLVLLHDGAPVGFSILAVREDRGWIGGFGIVPEARRKGFGHRLLEAQLQVARKRAPAGVQLEVLEQNPARFLYSAHGFEPVRRLAILRRVVPVPPAAASEALRLHAAPLARGLVPYPSAAMPWQREILAVLRHADAATEAWRIEREGVVEAHIVLERESAGLARLALVAAAQDGFADTLAALDGLDGVRQLLLINEPEGTPLHASVMRAGWETLGWQVEMRREFDDGAAS